MAKHISADTIVLDDPSTAGNDIDRVLNTMLLESRPVYIGVPVDMSHLECDARGLETPLKTTLTPNDGDLEREVVAEIRSRLECSENPIIIVDGNAVRNNLSEMSRKVSMITELPTFTTCMGKGALDETQPNFGGVYQGAGSHAGVREAIEAADFVLWIGNVQVSRGLKLLRDANNKADDTRPTSTRGSSRTMFERTSRSTCNAFRSK